VNGDKFPDEIKKALLVSIVVSYATPFTKAQVSKNKRIIPLDERLVPQRYKKIHSEFLIMRNRVFGHKDATVGPSFGPVNKVIIHVAPTFLDVHTASPFELTKSALQETIQLCRELITIADQHVSKFVTMHFNGGKIPELGIYEIDIEAASENWLVKKL
jgi:hypothetical protein